MRERPYVQPLSAVAVTEVAYAGGKGAALARLFQAGLPVPLGCVVSTHALATFLAAQHLPPTCSADAIRQIVLTAALPAELEAEVRSALLSLQTTPHGWAVRSSAVAEYSATAS